MPFAVNQIPNLIILDDDPEIQDNVKASLERGDLIVHKIQKVYELMHLLNSGVFDLVILDINLEDGDGLDLTQKIRTQFDVGILLLSNDEDLTEKILALELGADDYLLKPFNPRELLARVKSILRRTYLQRSHKELIKRDRPTLFQFMGWELNLTTRTLFNPEGEFINLTSDEFQLLECLILSANTPLSREKIISDIYKEYTPAFDRSIDVKIGRLRKKLNEPQHNPAIIKTIRNAGYMFSAPLSSQTIRA